MSRLRDLASNIDVDPSDDLKNDCTCPHCKRRYSGADKSGGHCVTCHRSFRSQSGFDKHRIGRFDIDRRCMTEDELSAVMVCSDTVNQLWRFPPPKNPIWGNKKEGENT